MASVDSGVETSNDSNDSSAPAEPPSNGSPASKSKEIVLYQVPSLITCSNSFEARLADALQRTGEETLQFRCPIPVLPTFSALPLSPKNEYSFASDLTKDCERNPNLDLKTSLKMARRLSSSFRSAAGQRTLRLQPFNYNHCFERGERKLRIAVTSNNIELVEKLLRMGMDPNCRDSHKRTPLHLAACRGYADIVRLLLDHNADPNQRDLLGNTPLHLAACTNNIVVVTLLLKAGTDVKSTDDYGRNPLQIAQSKLKLLQKLFSNDISAHIKNQVYQIIEMLREFLNRRGQDSEAELINSFSSRLTLSQTKDQVEKDVCDLLASLPHLSLSEESGRGGERRWAADSGCAGGHCAGGHCAGGHCAGGHCPAQPDSTASSLVPAIASSGLSAKKQSEPFSLRSAWWAPSLDECNCNLEACRACRGKTGTAGSSSGFESLME